VNIVSVLLIAIFSILVIDIGKMMFSSNTVSAVTINDDLTSNNNYNEGYGDRIPFESLFEDYGNYEHENHHLVPGNQDYNSGSSYSDSNSIVSEDDYQSSYSDENLFVSDDDYLTFSDTDTDADAEKQSRINEHDKFVIIMFDRGYDSIFSTAKPILDKYGFKASIFIACDYIDSDDGMNWNQVKQLYLDGHDIQSHGLEHTKLTEIKSSSKIESIVSGGKECLEERGFSPTVFQAPYNKGGDDPKIVDKIGQHFDLAFTGHSELMFLNCDGWENFGYDKENYQDITDCRPYFDDGTPTPTNKYAMKEWSHDREHDDIKDEVKGDPHGEEVSELLFEKFVQIVNDQRDFNKNGEINAIPIIGYHKISTEDSVSTSPELFEAEMDYLYENGFKVITIADLGYDEYDERFYIGNMNT